MWVHYAEAHREFVIGFDANVFGFTSTDANSMLAQFGSMIYTEQKPKHKLVASALMQVDGEISYRPELLEKLQRLFLLKLLCWSYEQEVWIVKCVKGIEHAAELPSGTFTLFPLGDRRSHLLALPDDAIREVDLGVRNPIIAQGEIQSFAAEMHKHQRVPTRRRTRTREVSPAQPRIRRCSRVHPGLTRRAFLPRWIMAQEQRSRW